MGPFEALLSNQGDFAHFIAEHTKNESTTEAAAVVPQALISDAGTLGGKTVLSAPPSTASKALSEVNKAKLIEKEGVSEGDVKRAIYLSYFRANGYAKCIIILLLYFLTFGTNIYSNIWLS